MIRPATKEEAVKLAQRDFCPHMVVSCLICQIEDTWFLSLLNKRADYPKPLWVSWSRDEFHNLLNAIYLYDETIIIVDSTPPMTQLSDIIRVVDNLAFCGVSPFA